MLRSEFGELQLEIPRPAIEKLALYASEVEHWNRSINLTSLRGSALTRRLIVDPVWMGMRLEMTGALADVGSGNGSPGIPLSITRAFSSVNLIEPRMKRAVFLRHIAAKAALKSIAVHRCRVESVPAKTVISDWITLQAVDPTPALLTRAVLRWMRAAAGPSFCGRFYLCQAHSRPVNGSRTRPYVELRARFFRWPQPHGPHLPHGAESNRRTGRNDPAEPAGAVGGYGSEIYSDHAHSDRGRSRTLDAAAP